MKKKYYLILFLTFIYNSSFSQTGPVFVKNSLTNQGAFSTPTFEFTTEFDAEKDSNNPDSTVRGILIKGLEYSKADNAAKETKFFAWFGVPNNIPAGEKRPAVILVHGGGGNAYTKWVDKWTEKGYIAIALGLEGYEPLKLTNKLNGAVHTTITNFGGPSRTNMFFADTSEAIEDQWFYHAVADVILVNNLLRDPTFSTQIDTDNIGITGISWGGIITNVVTGIDDRFKFSVPVYGCGYLFESPIYAAQLNILSETAKEFYLDNWEPSLYIPLQTQPTLFVNGTNDKQFTMNIFTDTYLASPNEKYLRIEKEMLHGHSPGWSPEEIYDFADYITNFKPSAIKPLTFTSEAINDNNEIDYKFEFNGTVDEAVLYYATDTINWKQDQYTWIPENVTFNKTGINGIITARVPDNAQVYFVNVKNTTTNKLYSSSMKYVFKDYDWYNYQTETFDTEITNTFGGTLEENVTNPQTNGINTSPKVGKMTKVSGVNSQIRFNLNIPINDLSNFKQKLQIYADVSDISTLTSKKIRVYLTNKTIGFNANSIFKDFTIASGKSWLEASFDFTSTAMPQDIKDAGGINEMVLMFAPGDSNTNGTIYYFDKIRGKIAQPKPTPPVVFYDWLNYGKSTPVEDISYVGAVGGTYTPNYTVTNDSEVIASNSESGKSIKFTKIAEGHPFTQARYNFDDGALNESTVTFKLRALLLPETIREINIMSKSSTGILFVLRNEKGDKPEGVPVQLAASQAFFSQFNLWEDLEIVFESENLSVYDRLSIIVAPNQTSPLDENENKLTDEDMVYYFEFLSATTSPAILSIDDNIKKSAKVKLFSNPVHLTLKLSKNVLKGTIFSITGQKINSFTNQNYFDVSSYKAGIYFLNITLENGQTQSLKFIKN
ncbi:MAG: dienelactone hydrolase [Polaribacter sp.]|jgi:dienelactone hydrolase